MLIFSNCNEFTETCFFRLYNEVAAFFGFLLLKKSDRQEALFDSR
jgi:hypothetical protein